MIRLMLSLMLASTIAATSTLAMARSRHRSAPVTRASVTHLHNRCFDAGAAAGRYAGYVDYNPCADPNAVFVGGTYAGADPDPNIRAALIREFGRRRR